MNRFFIITTLFLVFAVQSRGQFFARYSSCDRKVLEKTIEENRKIHDEKSLELSIDKIIENSDKKSAVCFQIIKNVLLAELATNKVDIENPTSSELYQAAIKKSLDAKNEQMQIWGSISYAFYLYSYGNYEGALPYFIKVGQLAQSFPGEKMIFPSDTYKKLGYFTGYIREYEKGIEYLKLAEKYTPEMSSEMAALKDNIGVFYTQNNNPEEAREYFEQALKIAVNVKDTLRHAKILGNTADLHKRSKDYSKAIDLLHQDIYLSRKSGNNMNTMYALLRITELYLETGEVDKAKLAALNARSIAQSKVYFKASELESAKLLLQIALKEGNSEDELALRRNIDSISIALKIPEGKNTISNLNWEVQKQNFNEELNKEKQRVQKGAWVRNGILFLSAILLLAGGGFLIKQNSKSKKISDDYQSTLKYLWDEKYELETKLREANNSVTAYATYLSEKNQQIERLESEINNIKSVFNTDKNREELHKLLESHLMTEENWNRFKTAFALEYPDFYTRLVKNYPELTEANWRIILLRKLGLNNGEIAHLLGVTIEAVKKAKQRLKKKLNGEYESLMGTSTVGEEL